MSAYAQHRLVINVKRRHLTLLVAVLLRSIVIVWTALQASSKRFFSNSSASTTESSRYRFLLPPKLRKEGRQKVKGIPHNFLLLDYTSCYILRDPKEEPLRNSMQRYLQKFAVKNFLEVRLGPFSTTVKRHNLLQVNHHSNQEQ